MVSAAQLNEFRAQQQLHAIDSTRMGSFGDKLTCHIARLLMSIMLVSMKGGLMMGLLHNKTPPWRLHHQT